MIPPLGSCPQQKPSLKETVQGDMLMLHDPASWVTADWIDTLTQGCLIHELDQSDSRICPSGHRNGSQRKMGAKKERLCGVGPMVDF